METLKFKTNINCGGCVKSVTPHLNQLEQYRKLASRHQQSG